MLNFIKMKLVSVVLCFVLFEASGYPYYPFYGNFDTLSYGASDSSRGGMVFNRYYNPYYTPQVGGGMAAFMFKQPSYDNLPSQYYMPDKRRQTQQDPNFLPPPQENEVYYPVIPVASEKPVTEVTEITNPTEKNFQPTEIPSTTVKAAVPELIEPEVEEVEEKPRRVPKKKQIKRPVVDEEDDEQPKMPSGALFPMYFGLGRNGGGSPGGATAIANAYSTGRGGVATSHANAFGMPPDLRNFKDYKTFQQQE